MPTDFFQWLFIGGAQRDATAAGHTADQAKNHAKDLERTVDRLTLACLAMWELVREKTDLDNDDLMQRITEIDLRDGHLDDRLVQRRRECPSCARTTHGRRDWCLYCGHAFPRTSPFHG